MSKQFFSFAAIILILTVVLAGCSLPGWNQPASENIEEAPIETKLGLDLSGIFIGSWLEWSESRDQPTGYAYSFYEDGRVLISRQDINSVVIEGAYQYLGSDAFSIRWSLPSSELYFEEMIWEVQSIKNNELIFWVDSERFVTLKRLENQTSFISPPLQEDPTPIPAPPPIIDPPKQPQSSTSKITPKIMINEIAWAGTTADQADQWIELYNTTDEAIDLTDWTLSWGEGDRANTIRISDIDASASIKINTFRVPANGYYVMERADDETIHGIGADLIFSGLLDADGEKLELRDASGIRIDTANISGSAWPAGTTGEDILIAYASMERLSPSEGDVPSNWATFNGSGSVGFDGLGNEINGTPGAENSQFQN